MIGRITVKKTLELIYCGKSLFLDPYTGIIQDLNKCSIEHVVPKSKIPKHMKWDLNNLLLVDKHINMSRGNKAFGKGLFIPKNKGQVARICAHMIDKCEEENVIVNKNNEIIKIETMLEWNDLFPVSDIEKYSNEIIFDVAGTYNEYIESDDKMCKWFKY